MQYNKLSKKDVEERLSTKNFKIIGEYKNTHTSTLIKCHCGNDWIVSITSLLSNTIRSCGCLSNRNLNYTDKIFGRLTVMCKDDLLTQIKKRTIWKCQCSCNNLEFVFVSTTSLKLGYTKSCGCLRKEVSAKQLREKLHPNQNGENNPAYQSKLTYEDRINRRCLKQNKWWIEEVFKRDNYTCQICLKRGGNLCSHHLDGYHWCKEKRFDINNGITLCDYHHKDFHLKYSNKFNTKNQFDEYRYGL